MKPRLGKKGRKALAVKKAAPKKKAAKRALPTPRAPEPETQPETVEERNDDCCNRYSPGETHATGCVSGLGGTTPGGNVKTADDAPATPA